jgi:uncharacterized surface protein with fasciclin (FAS1) repeats
MKAMKNLSRLLVLTALSTAILVSSCKKDDTPAPTPTPTVVGVAQSDTSFSILVAAVTKAGLVSTLSDETKSYTVFAPTNKAFRDAGIDATVIAGYTAAQVTDVLIPILTYHVVGAKVLSTGVPASDTVKTVNGKNIFASKNANGVFVNGIKVTTADLNASNGVVHVIGKVLIPPTKTITEIVVGNANFSLLKAAVIRANLATVLGSPGKYTVFAPVNSGFPASLNTDALINAAPVATVAGIVTSHAFGTNIFAGDLTAGETGATLNSATKLTIGLSPAPNVKISGSTATASGITTTDIVATNGVIHIIDKILL